nr:uncharacterized protein LOC129269556 [Lytechinus pictus]
MWSTSSTYPPPSPSDSSSYSSQFSTTVTAAESIPTCYRQMCSEKDGGPVTCRCDKRCFFFGDCCYGIRVPPPFVLERLQFDTTVWDCVEDTFLPPIYQELNHGYRMVTRCPQSWDKDDVRRKCESVSSNNTEHIMYTDGDDYYRNVHCVICSGIDESSVSPIYGSDQCSWQSKNELKCLLDANSTSPIPDDMDNSLDNYTLVELYQEIPIPRLCLLDVEETCPNDNGDPNLQNKCRMYFVPVLFNSSIYKNPFCALCNDQREDLHSYCKIPVRKKEGERGADYFNVGIGAAFSGIVNREQMAENKDEQVYRHPLLISSIWPLCKSKQTYLIYKNGKVECFGNESCSINSNIPKGDAREVDDFLFEINLADALSSHLDLEDIPPLVTFLQRLRNRSHEMYIPQVLTVKHWCHTLKYNQESLGKSNCSNELYEGEPNEFSPFVLSNDSYIFFNGSFVKPIWWFNQTALWFEDTNWKPYPKMYLCGTEHEVQFCPSIAVATDSVDWVERFNKTLLKYKNKIYFQEDFFLHPDGRIRICIDEENQLEDFVYTGLNIVGNVAFAVSSACLFATLLTYLVFSELQNRQGIVVINFIVALLLGQIFLQYVGYHFSDRFIPCLAFASLSHFFFLASFVWTTVLAWDLRRSLSASVIFRSGQSCFHTTAYALIGWGIPLVITSTTLLMQLGGFTDEPILEYGGPACLFATRLSSLAVFFGPICLCLLTNCLLFIGTMRNLHSTNKSTAIARKNSGSAIQKQLTLELRIFVKISALLGFAWLFGFLAMVVNILVTWYLFIIVSGLQGFFIFISFGANRRARGLWGTLLGKAFSGNATTRTESGTQSR